MATHSITKECLESLGFKEVSKLHEYVFDENDSSHTKLVICLSNSTPLMALEVNQFDWNHMEGNVTYTPIIHEPNNESLTEAFEKIKSLITHIPSK